MHVPATLDEWTYDAIIELARLGRCEGERHDFKFNLPDATNLTKICCAFANSLGGVVVVGIKDRSGHFVVEGINPDGEIAKKFSDKVKAVPSVEYVGPRVVAVPGNQ
jgi:predicted HTH transcriptional regulator